jgi:predicted transcriptional regulator/DNA-binding XRE family transcriptional regulator
MAESRALFIGPRIRRLRREIGVTQAQMAAELGVSASYIALIERNQRPLTAELLLRLAETYRLDIASFAGDGGAKLTAHLRDLAQDPLFADLDILDSDLSELATGSPAIAEGLVRLYTAFRESQLALADQAERTGGNPLEETRAFLDARRNHFPVLDDRSERLAAAIAREGGLADYLHRRHGFEMRLLPTDVMNGTVRRLDHHRRQLALDETLDGASRRFQLALQLAYLELGDPIDAALAEGQFTDETAKRIARRALGNYAAGAILMPYAAFFREAEARSYDIEALGRVFRTSFEQTCHRLTTLGRPGASGIPFFFIRVDQAGNVSKRFDAGDTPFARHGGSCPLWSVHATFQRPRELLTELVELPEGERYLTLARTVTAGGGTFGAPRVVRAVALGCDIAAAARTVYGAGRDLRTEKATPIGKACRLCYRAECAARAEPPLGRQLLPDDYRRPLAPFGFGDR